MRDARTNKRANKQTDRKSVKLDAIFFLGGGTNNKTNQTHGSPKGLYIPLDPTVKGDNIGKAD